MAESLRAYRAEPYSYAEARALSEALGLSEPVAITLVRRGFRTPEQARVFLDADEDHSPGEFEGMDEVVERILAAIRERRRITVHGDFDVDGVCATSIAVGALRELGADCDWFIPDRMADGYGLSTANVERLAEHGTSLLLTVDCGIGSAAEVRAAQKLGLEVIVTDHHEPPAQTPPCPILHPRLSGYPFGELCGSAVAWKLTAALREAAGGPPGAELADLDLVALATVADVVPLIGENRSLVKRGLEVARRARRPGLRALLAAAGCEPARLDEGDFGFRLGPRINAAGRLYRADAGVELFLSDDEARAEQIAAELNRANAERRETGREVEHAAEAAHRELPEELRDAPGLVLAGRGWHPGVVGIVASRMVDRHWRPVVVVSLDEEGGGRGSGRSIPGFDLLAGLEACSQSLESFGGHRAAAGLQLAPGALDAFRRDFAEHAASVLGPEQLTRTEPVDAMVGGEGIGLPLAEELERLGPFGAGNPGVRLLVPSARVRDVRSMGEGRHSRFSLHSGEHRALGVAFGRATLPVEADESVDAAVRLEVNHWNGSVEPRLVLRDLYPLAGAEAPAEEESRPGHSCDCEAEEWWRRLHAELGAELEAAAAADAPAARTTIRHDASPAAVLAELVSSGAGVLAVCADAGRRAELAAGATGMARFAAASANLACGRCPEAEIEAALGAKAGGGLALTDYDALALAPDAAAAFAHVVLVDPPVSQGALASLARPGPDGGFMHPVWGRAEQGFALAVLDEQLGLRMQLRAAFRDLREAAAAKGEVSGDQLREALRGSARHRRSPELAGRCLRVLLELELVRGNEDGTVRTLGVVSSDRTELERSGSFRAYAARHEEGKRFLERARQP